jgi:hypothetical protein
MSITITRDIHESTTWSIVRCALLMTSKGQQRKEPSVLTEAAPANQKALLRRPDTSRPL